MSSSISRGTNRGRELMDRRAEDLANISDARSKAAKALPPVLFRYVDGGADDEVTLAQNRLAYEQVNFRPRAAAFPQQTRLQRTVLGSELTLPVIVAPCGGVRLVHRDG